MVEEAKLSTLNEPQKHVSILVDEMKIQQNLVYNKQSGKLIGFRDLGDVNNELLS